MKQAKKEGKKLIKELPLTTEERNELRDRLIYVTEGSMNSSPYFRPNPFYEKLKIKEKEVMSLLHNLEIKNTEHCQKFQELKKEINFYRNLQSRLLMDQACMKKKLVTLKQESKEVQLDYALLQKYLVELNLDDKDQQGEDQQPPTQQHLVSETSRELDLNTLQEESLLKNELLSQESPDDHNSEQSKKFWMNILPLS